MSLQIPNTEADELKARIEALMPEVRRDLEALVAIPSINFPGMTPAGRGPLRRSLVRNCCARLVPIPELIPSSSGVPTVAGGHRRAGRRSPGSALPHYDVQPAGGLDQ